MTDQPLSVSTVDIGEHKELLEAAREQAVSDFINEHEWVKQEEYDKLEAEHERIVSEFVKRIKHDKETIDALMLSSVSRTEHQRLIDESDLDWQAFSEERFRKGMVEGERRAMEQVKAAINKAFYESRLSRFVSQDLYKELGFDKEVQK